MAFDKAEFITSAPDLNSCPQPGRPEFCFAGRSNVGKSSLINKIANRKQLARTSNTPGKTQQMNYYLIDNSFYLVDLPGFGFAKVPEKERKRWGEAIRTYLLERSTIDLILHLVDIRHEPTRLDEEFFFWMGTNRIPFSIILAKCDKLSSNKINQSVQRLKNILDEMNIEVPILTCSAESGQGIGDVQSLILEFSKQNTINN